MSLAVPIMALIFDRHGRLRGIISAAFAAKRRRQRRLLTSSPVNCGVGHVLRVTQPSFIPCPPPDGRSPPPSLAAAVSGIATRYNTNPAPARAPKNAKAAFVAGGDHDRARDEVRHRGASTRRGRHRPQADVEAAGPVRHVLHDERKQRAEHAGADAVQQLHAHQPIGVVRERVEEAAGGQDREPGRKDRLAAPGIGLGGACWGLQELVRRSCRGARCATACAARSSATRCPARSPWSPRPWRRRRGSGCRTSPAAGPLP